jgi:hypothetical protein
MSEPKGRFIQKDVLTRARTNYGALATRSVSTARLLGITTGLGVIALALWNPFPPHSGKRMFSSQVPMAPSPETSASAPLQPAATPLPSGTAAPAVSETSADLTPQSISQSATLGKSMSAEAAAKFREFFLGKADTMQAKSHLKKYQVQQAMYLTEQGRLASMKDLELQGEWDKALQQAWDGQPAPDPLQGFLFSEIDRDENGQPLDHASRAGLCAYPVKPAAGRPVLCMLLDFRKQAAPDDSNPESFRSSGDEWNYYEADSTRVNEPVRSWPAAGRWTTVFTRQRKYGAGEAVAEARRISGEAGKPTYPKPEMAQRAKEIQANGTQELARSPVRATLAKLKPVVYLYYEENGRLPTAEEGLKVLPEMSGGAIKPADLTDPWGLPYLYKTREVSVRGVQMLQAFVYSAGPDRQPGTPDDIYPED